MEVSISWPTNCKFSIVTLATCTLPNNVRRSTLKPSGDTFLEALWSKIEKYTLAFSSTWTPAYYYGYLQIMNILNRAWHCLKSHLLKKKWVVNEDNQKKKFSGEKIHLQWRQICQNFFFYSLVKSAQCIKVLREITSSWMTYWMRCKALFLIKKENLKLLSLIKKLMVKDYYH